MSTESTERGRARAEHRRKALEGALIPPATGCNFSMVPWPASDEQEPSGLRLVGRGYERAPLRTVMPELGRISLTYYYHLPMACCAHLIVAGATKIVHCKICDNQGWVCPMCRGARWLAADWVEPEHMMRCPGCVYERVDDKGRIYGTYDAERALVTARTWLARHFPYGLPERPTQADLAIMHGEGT